MTVDSWCHPNWARLQDTRLESQKLCCAFRMQICLMQLACNSEKRVLAKLHLTYPPARDPVCASACLRIIWLLCNMQQSTSLSGQSFGQILVSIQSLQPVTLLLLHGCKAIEDLFLCVLHFKQWMCWKTRRSCSPLELSVSEYRCQSCYKLSLLGFLIQE